MRPRIAVLSACLVLLAFAVSPPAGAWDDRPRLPIQTGSYFPLQVGNQWVYEVRDPAVEPTNRVVSVTEQVPGTDGLPYFALEGYLGPKRFVRSLRNGTVLERNPEGGPDYLWYLLQAPVGAQWTFSLGGDPRFFSVHGKTVTVASRTDVVRVPAGEFRNVVRLHYSPPSMDGGIQAEWFAPGVGLIKRQEATIISFRTMELTALHLGSPLLPRPAYGASLLLDRPLYVQNLMPSPSPELGIAVVDAAFLLSNLTGTPVESIFGGCRSATFAVVDSEGKELIKVRGDDGGCCACATPLDLPLVRGSLLLRAKIRLALEDGTPLPPGHYAVAATLDAVNVAPPLLPSARVPIEVIAAY